jgi:hypothetical protein
MILFITCVELPFYTFHYLGLHLHKDGDIAYLVCRIFIGIVDVVSSDILSRNGKSVTM